MRHTYPITKLNISTSSCMGLIVIINLIIIVQYLHTYSTVWVRGLLDLPVKEYQRYSHSELKTRPHPWVRGDAGKMILKMMMMKVSVQLMSIVILWCTCSFLFIIIFSCSSFWSSNNWWPHPPAPWKQETTPTKT